MVRNLERGQNATRELPIQKQLHFKEHEARDRDINLMVSIIDNIIAGRRAEGGTKQHNDLLDSMLNGVDKETGLKLDDINIRAQCNTFLVAGHETTSGLLSFAVYYLTKHPGVAARAYEEVDRVLGSDLGVMPTYAQTHRLPYISQILNETLRLNPTAPIFSRQPLEETVIGGKYHLDKGEGMSILLGALHRDKSVWGDNAEEFDPDHFSPENEAKLPPNSFKPFGTGIRACIGRQFALQEATLVLGMLLQRFEFVDSENYQLQTKQALTIKPSEFHLGIKPRAGRSPAAIPLATVAAAPQPAPQPAPQAAPATDGHNTPLLVLYGSNLGTAEHLAREIANDAANQGFNVTVGTLDQYVNKLPKEGGVVVVSASYNGMPPDNAAKFVAWLEDSSLPADAFTGVEFTVFGCGNRDWGTTYQAVPTLIDAQLAAHGAKRMYKRGEGDARGDFDGDYRSWYSPLWQSVAQELNVSTTASAPQKTSPRFQISFTNKRATSESVAAYEAYPMTVQVNRELQTRDGERPSDRSTRHVQVVLPEGTTYHTGDHLGILPVNSIESIQRVLFHYNLDPGFYITIAKSAKGTSYLPVDTSMPLLEVLASRVELQDVATRSQIQVLAEYTSDPQEKQSLLALAGDDDASRALYQQQVFAPNKSLLDLMEEYSSSELPFEVFLALLPPLKPRYYSIASSPMVSPDKCDLAVAVVDAPARSGRGTFRGVSSTYLERMPQARPVIGFIRQPTIPFHPPENPHTAMIMVGAGTGVAPFRGFLQERAALKAKGAPVGESLLFFGCRDPLQDYIFQQELGEFESQGIVKVYMGFSRVPGQEKKYVQDTIREQSDEVWRLLGNGAIVFVCGEANRMAPAVRAAFMDVFRSKTNASELDAQAWLSGLKESKRYLEDIWGGKGIG
jgi:cytochrome P450/NADPH-cytochrome P450 reductase